MALYQEIGNHGEIPAILHNQGYVALGTDDDTAARELFAESLRRQQAAGNLPGVVEGINGLAALTARQGQLERAARLYWCSRGDRRRATRAGLARRTL